MINPRKLRNRGRIKLTINTEDECDDLVKENL